MVLIGEMAQKRRHTSSLSKWESVLPTVTYRVEKPKYRKENDMLTSLNALSPVSG